MNIENLSLKQAHFPVSGVYTIVYRQEDFLHFTGNRFFIKIIKPRETKKVSQWSFH